MKSIKIVLILQSFLAIYLGCCLLQPHFGLRINQTSSLPYTLFLSTRLSLPKKYNYITLHHLSTPTLLAKQIIGLPGDSIDYHDNHIFVDHVDCGEVLRNAPCGMALTPLAVKKIPEGYVFVHAPHAASFDSRYQEFGLIQINQLREVLWPIY